MLVTTTIVGPSNRKVPSLSSASATRNRPCPSRALLSSACRRPPMTIVGSKWAWASTVAISDVVVVLPCVPATAMPYLRRINSASISARGMTGIIRSRARTTSGLANFTAEEMTTTSVSGSTCSGRWPYTTCAPLRARRSVVSDSATSDPLIR